MLSLYMIKLKSQLIKKSLIFTSMLPQKLNIHYGKYFHCIQCSGGCIKKSLIAEIRNLSSGNPL